MAQVYLKKDRDRPVLRGHPWIFSGAIERSEGDESPGVADVLDAKGNWLARGLYNPRSQIRVRVLTWRQEAIGGDFFAGRLRHAHALRQRQLSAATSAYRVVNGEGDFLPGLIVDRYGGFLVCQFYSAAMALFRAEILNALSGLETIEGIFERSEGRVGDEEGIAPSVGVLRGAQPPPAVEVSENGRKFLVDIRHGQKTGFFLDQRENRGFLASLARDCSVLNAFAYTGSFSVYGFTGGAREIVSFDSSQAALELAERNLEINGFADAPGELLKGDAFGYLKEIDKMFDLIVLDPPSLAHKRSDVDPAAGGYKFLNLHALRHLNRGGVLLTFSGWASRLTIR